MKLDIQLFGGRGANSSLKREMKISIDGNQSTLQFEDIQKGDKFTLNYKGTDREFTITSEKPSEYGFMVEGGYLQGEGVTSYLGYMNIDGGKQSSYTFPFSKTKNWKRKIK